MKRIVLLCAAGMSTSLLVERMKKCAATDNYECEIAAYPVSEASKAIPESDIALLGPQVRYLLKKLQEQYPDKNIESIEMQSYGMMDGEAVLKHARKIMGD